MKEVVREWTIEWKDTDGFRCRMYINNLTERKSYDTYACKIFQGR